MVGPILGAVVGFSEQKTGEVASAVGGLVDDGVPNY